MGFETLRNPLHSGSPHSPGAWCDGGVASSSSANHPIMTYGAKSSRSRAMALGVVIGAMKPGRLHHRGCQRISRP